MPGECKHSLKSPDVSSRQVARATKLSAVVPNILGVLIAELDYVTRKALRNLYVP